MNGVRDGHLVEDVCSWLIDIETNTAPQRLVSLLRARSDPLGGDQSLGFFAYSYQRAFEELFRIAHERGHAGGLWPPLLLLCRHSVELSIKAALEAFEAFSDPLPSTPSHSLLAYWRRLLWAMGNAGIEIDDEFTASCTVIVKQLHVHDTRGDRFRYPTTPKGEVYASTLASPDLLFRGHWRVTCYCQGAVDMLREGWAGT